MWMTSFQARSRTVQERRDQASRDPGIILSLLLTVNVVLDSDYTTMDYNMEL